jgi:hypothetical protein
MESIYNRIFHVQGSLSSEGLPYIQGIHITQFVNQERQISYLLVTFPRSNTITNVKAEVLTCIANIISPKVHQKGSHPRIAKTKIQSTSSATKHTDISKNADEEGIKVPAC